MVMMPTAYFMYWMERSAAGFLSYFGIFALMFAFIWIIQFMIGKRDVKKLNENLCQSRKNEKNEVENVRMHFWPPPEKLSK